MRLRNARDLAETRVQVGSPYRARKRVRNRRRVAGASRDPEHDARTCHDCGRERPELSSMPPAHTTLTLVPSRAGFT